MEEYYTSDLLSSLDEIIRELSFKSCLDYQAIRKYHDYCFEILQSEGWVFLLKIDQMGTYYVGKSEGFDKLLAGGTFSERYRRKLQFEQQKQQTEININNSSFYHSPVAVGNSINHSIVNVKVNDLPFDEAINDVRQAGNFSFEKKQDVIDSIQELKECIQNSQRPGKSLLKNIFNWSEHIVGLSKNLTEIYTTFRPLFEGLFPAN